MEYLIRFAQVHESFRKPEIEALATLVGTNVEFLEYTENTPFALIKLQDEAAARAVISRSILAKGIYEVWGRGQTYAELHTNIRKRTASRWNDFKNMSFKFSIDSYAGKRSAKEKIQLIQSFAYMGFQGTITMTDPDEKFCIFEEYPRRPVKPGEKRPAPNLLYFGRWIACGSRDVIDKYDLKKRNYISTTSMDAELTLVTANMALAAPGKVFFDPFVGTGSFCVAMAHFGTYTLGADIDGRSFSGKDKQKGKSIGLVSNLEQYGIQQYYLDVFISDLTNTPIRATQFLDGIICDPPYGVREGLKVLGNKDGKKREPFLLNGVPSYFLDGYIAPKKPYSFDAMLDDILEFAAIALVQDGRISLWMPTANEDDVELQIPSNPHLELLSVCVQPFGHWSRRLLTYRRLPDGEVSHFKPRRQREEINGVNADDLNAFRRKYFTKSKSEPKDSPDDRAP
ncbi:tRNA guanosine-2'-O-methyltransferase TRM11 [Paracoccidioides lutzii Pb01]|uniref:tRNA (guanine(10)-N(2))-methyltransferase n=1 Tax=Paracoccidioides lutzii (strain ATCC MYA-826 / Pb01) TaxID=502779 RepID=C1GW91_PARBA|nr:tRNA guanosine-2'-O-methyltransferase TRM11 [Paracoccidioides lutzii Pb01]EEH40810.1 tRNA guanosine-2'-O-methyltransferase TRM11 [Paracoccidioides lutzii Pb01]